MSTIVDRYVAAVGSRLPEGIRRDVEEELRATISDIMESRYGDLSTDEAAVSAVESLGDPVKLAREYAPRPGYLIGPGLFDTYRRLLSILVALLAPIVLVAVMVARVLDAHGVTASGILAAISSALQAGVWVCFWVTLIFAVLERKGVRSTAVVRTTGQEWTVADLPAEVSVRQVKLGEVVSSAAFATVFICLLVVQHFRSTFSDAHQGPIPFLDPALWKGWLPVLMALVVVGVAIDVLRYSRGRYTLGLTIASSVTDVIFGALAAGVLLTRTVVNPAWMDALRAEIPDLDPSLVVFNQAVWTAFLLAIVAWSIAEAWLKYRKARARP